MQKGSQKSAFPDPLMILADAPVWLEAFTCSAGDCPDTCCSGWNIEIDVEHAKFYSQLNDPDIASFMPQMIRKVRSRKNGKESERSFLSILGQPDQTCLFFNAEKRCMLQEKFGENALCETCRLFPRELWQENQRWFMSASLCCPEIRKLALTTAQPFSVRQMMTAEDSQSEWLETDLIPNVHSRALFSRRSELVKMLIAQLENPSQNVLQKLEQCVLWLLSMPSAFEKKMPYFENIPFRNSEFSRGAQDANVIRACFGFVDEILNWDVQKAPKSILATRNLSDEMMTGGVSSPEFKAHNYLNVASAYIDPFLMEHGKILENFYKHYFFSLFLRQFNDAMNDEVYPEHVIHYELYQLIVINTLLMQSLAVRVMRNRLLTTADFLDAVGFIARNFLHYPDFLNRSIRGHLAQHRFDAEICRFIRL